MMFQEINSLINQDITTKSDKFRRFANQPIKL